MIDVFTMKTDPPGHRRAASSPGKIARIPVRGTNTNPDASSERIESEALAVEIEKLKGLLDQMPEIDTAKIVDLHNRIASGEYKIDSKTLAEKLRKFESEL